MLRLSVNEMTTYRWTFDEDIQHYRDAGIRAIGVWRSKLSDFGEEKGIELLAESGMEVSSLSWVGGFTGSDGRSFKESVADARDAIRVAAELKARCVVVYSGARGGHTGNHARRLLKSALGELLPFAHEFGVCLAIEPMHGACGSDWTFLTRIDDSVKLLEETADSAVKLAFDTYHFGHDPAIIAQLPTLADRVGIVHLGDARTAPDGESNRCPLGEGVLQLGEIVAALHAAGYRGFFDVKLMGEEIEACDYADLLRRTRAVFDQLAESLGSGSLGSY